jgi:hypothetical protein
MGNDAFELRIEDLLVARLVTEATEVLDGFHKVMIQKRQAGGVNNHGVKLWQ